MIITLLIITLCGAPLGVATERLLTSGSVWSISPPSIEYVRKAHQKYPDSKIVNVPMAQAMGLTCPKETKT